MSYYPLSSAYCHTACRSATTALYERTTETHNTDENCVLNNKQRSTEDNAKEEEGGFFYIG